MAQLMPLPLTVSCFSKIQIGFTFLVPAHLGSPGKRAIKRVLVVNIQYLVRSSSNGVFCCQYCSNLLLMRQKYETVGKFPPATTHTEQSGTRFTEYLAIVRVTYDSDLKRAEISLRNIVSQFTNAVSAYNFVSE